MDELDPTPAHDLPADPLEAMRQVMAQAEAAAAARAKAKAEGRSPQASFALPEGAEEAPALSELAAQALAAMDAGPHAPLQEAFEVDEDEDLDLLVALAAKDLTEASREERHGDLVLVKDGPAPAPWYREAAEEALPASLRGLDGTVDLKLLLQALLVEVGDVKRTNAMLLDKLIGVEEEVRGLRRLMRGRS